jgi:hypothetical protein
VHQSNHRDAAIVRNGFVSPKWFEVKNIILYQ